MRSASSRLNSSRRDDRRASGGLLQRQIESRHHIAGTHQQRALNHVIQFAHIAGPGVLAQRVKRLRRESHRPATVTLAVLPQEMFGQRPGCLHVDRAAAAGESQPCSAGRANPDETSPGPLPHSGRHWSPIARARLPCASLTIRRVRILQFPKRAAALVAD